MKPQPQEKAYEEETAPPLRCSAAKPSLPARSLLSLADRGMRPRASPDHDRHRLALLYYSIPRSGSSSRFLFSEEWNPVTQEFGALSSIYGTLVSTCWPCSWRTLSLAIALFLVELAPPRLSRTVAP